MTEPTKSGELVPKVFDGELVVRTDDNQPVQGGARVRQRVLDCVGYVVRRARESRRFARARSVIGYRVRKLPRDMARMVWFLVRGHGRWIAKAWTWATHGDLRADARAARLSGDPQARREAQEAIRADARARWAKLGIATRRVMVGAAVGLAVLLLLVSTPLQL